MKEISIALVLMFAASQASAAVVNNAMKKKLGVANEAVNVVIPPVLPQIVPPPPAPLPVVFVEPPAPAATQSNSAASKKAGKNKVEAPAPVVFFQPQVRLDDLVCEEPPKGGGDNVSAVPVPAALPLMATAFGIFGITRRRKAFK